MRRNGQIEKPYLMIKFRPGSRKSAPCMALKWTRTTQQPMDRGFSEASCKHSTWEKIESTVPIETKLYQEARLPAPVGESARHRAGEAKTLGTHSWYQSVLQDETLCCQGKSSWCLLYQPRLPRCFMMQLILFILEPRIDRNSNVWVFWSDCCHISRPTQTISYYISRDPVSRRLWNAMLRSSSEPSLIPRRSICDRLTDYEPKSA